MGEPLILAIDTSGEPGSVALARGAQLLECRPLPAEEAHSRTLFGEIRSLLSRQKIELSGVELFAAASGPGSFTGVRIGLAAAKGFAAVHAKKVAPVSNLAATAAMAPDGPRFLIPLLDARRSEVYASVYERDDQNTPQRRIEEWILRPSSLPEKLAPLDLAAAETAFCGPDVERLLAGTPTRFQLLTTGRILAASVARLAWEAYCSGMVVAPAMADANYLRRML